MNARKPNNSSGAVDRTPIFIALALSIILVFAVLIGARVVFGPTDQQRVSMSDLPSPDAKSSECSELIDALPDEAFGHRRATLVEPAPKGAAAWASSELEQVTLRCGVDLPLQYTALSETVDKDGVSWLPIVDTTPESTLETWYTVDRFPTVAITADKSSMAGADNPVEPFSSEIQQLAKTQNQPHPAPLSNLASDNQDQQCTPLFAALPQNITVNGEDGLTYTRIDQATLAQAGYANDTVGWRTEKQEPIVLRCGVKPSENYSAGARLQQVNDTPWFEDTVLREGTTTSIWYALGRTANIAISIPQSASQSLVTFTEAIESSVPQS